MRNTVIILNEELCSMSLAFEKAGYEILAACEGDRRSCEIYNQNIKSNMLYESIFDIDIYSLPDTDVIAGKIEIHDWKIHLNQNDAKNRDMLYVFQEMVNRKMPKCVLYEVNASAINTRNFGLLIEELTRFYKVNFQIYKVNEITRLPINERKLYVIGIREDIYKEYRFINEFDYPDMSMGEIFEYEDVNEWYYRVNMQQVNLWNGNEEIEDCKFLCWKEQGYFRSKNITWNTVKIPLIKVNEDIRRITHREVARLKGYPETFDLKISNKSWLYNKLMYASNIHLLYTIIRSIEYILNDRPLLNQQVMRAARFEELFAQFLEKYYDEHVSGETRDGGYDFVVEKNNEKVYFELKLYTNKVVSSRNVLKICERLYARIHSDGRIVLVWGNEIEEQIKNIAKEQYNIEIWDIGNILYLFQDFPEILNEFIALLNYTINNIEIKAPIFNIITDDVKDTEQNDLSTRLDRINPGKEESSKYEQICVEILKYVFGENLSLWRTQQKSNDGLYRFDLCCKIKHGDNQEFFDTLQDFFNTKYVVFEFKNYKDLISQSEIYTTEKYLYKTALRSVAIIVSRKGADNNALLAAKGCLRENGKLILCLSDEDLHNLINLKLSKEKPTAEVLSDMLDDMLINLEK